MQTTPVSARVPIGRNARDVLKRGLRRLFEAGQRAGVDILPRHFYSEIPDLRVLRSSEHWKRSFSMRGIRGADIGTQLEFVHSCCTPEIVLRLAEGDIHRRACAENGAEGYGPVEADFLYAFVRKVRPAEIVQVGCGVSTAVCLAAAKDAGYAPRIVCIEPYPTEFLRRTKSQGAIELVESKVETLPLEFFDSLSNDLLLFVDSSHTLGPAGEASRIVLEILPRLRAGARVHFHDITFPYDYDRHLLDGALVFPHESALLHAFLAYNTRFELAASLSMLHYAAREELWRHLPNYRPAGDDEGLETMPGHFPSAAYLRVTGDPENDPSAST